MSRPRCPTHKLALSPMNVFSETGRRAIYGCNMPGCGHEAPRVVKARRERINPLRRGVDALEHHIRNGSHLELQDGKWHLFLINGDSIGVGHPTLAALLKKL